MGKLTGKNAIVFGSAGGIGMEINKMLIREGIEVRVVVNFLKFIIVYILECFANGHQGPQQRFKSFGRQPY